MAEDKERDHKILRYHYAENWKVNSIASQLSIHHSTVDRVISQHGLPKAERARGPSILDDYLPLIIKTLEEYPSLTAARIYEMAKKRGYQGGESHFRACVAQHRPRKKPEAYLRLKTLPGEQSQVDWGHFGHIEIGKAKRPLMAFVMVLSWSRQVFVRFYLNQRMENFLRGHVEAFDAFGGIPRVLLYDNLKSAVLERKGNAIRFHPTLLELSSHYHFEPRPVAVARGNEKGRVERAIRYIRDSFFAGIKYNDINDLNAQVDEWCAGISASRSCPENNGLSVREAFVEEQPKLLTLPPTPYPTHERVEVSIGKTPYARFDLNDYSIPHTHVRQLVTVSASLDTVQILDGTEVIAQHQRSYDKHKQIENPEHIEKLVKYKAKASHHRGQDRLIHAIPSGLKFLELAAQRNYPLSSMISTLLEYMNDYGAAELEYAMKEALAHEVPHYNTVRQVLVRRREERDQPPPIAVALPNNEKARNVVVRPATLSAYDELMSSTDDEKSEDNTEQDQPEEHS